MKARDACSSRREEKESSNRPRRKASTAALYKPESRYVVGRRLGRRPEKESREQLEGGEGGA